MKKALIILFTCCLVVSLFFFISTTDLQVVMKLIRQIRYKFLLLLLTTFLAYLFGTLSWQFAMGKYSRCISTGRLFLIRHLGETAGMFNPASVIGGDALKVMILKDYDVPYKSVVWSMIFSRTIMVISQLLFFVGLLGALVIGQPAMYAGRMAGGEESALYLLLVSRWKILRLKCFEVFRELPLMFAENKKMLVFSFLFALLHWFFGGLEFYLILKFFGLDVSLVQALFVDLGVVFFKAAGAFIPGQLGIEEYGNKFMLMAIGVSGAQMWVTASILRRARQLVWVAFGIGIYLFMFRRLREMERS